MLPQQIKESAAGTMYPPHWQIGLRNKAPFALSSMNLIYDNCIKDLSSKDRL